MLLLHAFVLVDDGLRPIVRREYLNSDKMPLREVYPGLFCKILDYPCVVIDSLRYGIPLGLVSFCAILLQYVYLSELSSLWRWIGVAAVGSFLIIYSLKAKNKAFFPFRFAFLSAFNALVLTTLVTGLLMFVFKESFLQGIPEGVPVVKWVLSLIFMECMGFLFIAIITSAVLSLILRKK